MVLLFGAMEWMEWDWEDHLLIDSLVHNSEWKECPWIGGDRRG